MEENIIKVIAYGWYAGMIAMFEYLDLSHIQIWALTLFMFFDVVTWIAKQRRLDKQGITSNRLTVWIVAKLLVLLCIILIALWIKTIWIDWVTIAYLKLAISVLMVWELYSIIWNTYTFNTKQELPEYDVISKFLRMTTAKLKEILDKFFEHEKIDYKEKKEDEINEE